MTTISEPSPVDALPRAGGTPPARARFRTHDTDFRVRERIEVPEHPTGAHWWLEVTKTGMNTKDAVRALARLGSARVRQVGYAGLKDRHAVTTQWFSLPIETLDPESVVDRMPSGLELHQWRRARKAIRRGGLKANRFDIVLREVRGPATDIEARLDRLAAGVPNYFGEQRFGIDGANLAQARRMFDGQPHRVPRFERGLYLSAARAWLFNLVLAERVRAGSWNRLMAGEAVILDGSRSWFPLPDAPETLESRLAAFDIHPSGPLHGVGEAAARDTCADLERRVLAGEPGLAAGLERLGMRAERRALRLVPAGLAWSWSGDELSLSFELPPGTFATTVLREFGELEDASRRRTALS
jgi:tRNA pseudouridine13 synthase